MSPMRKIAGKRLEPEEVVKVLFTRDLPKSRSAKIMRRVIRTTYLGKEPGGVSDTGLTRSMVQQQYRHARSVASSRENPAAVNAVAEAT